MGNGLARELRIFSELAHVVAAGPYEVHEILERICREVREGFGFERALLVRYRPEDETVHAVVQQGIDWPGEEWLAIERFPFLSHARDSRRAIFVSDPRREGAIPSKIIERFGVRSVVAVPLAVEDRCVGFLVVDRRGGDFELAAEELELLTSLGSVAAVLIDKADQYAELQTALEELRRLDSVKAEFISIASHELRTPIAVVHGVSSTLHLRGDELSGDQLHELRRTLFDQTSRLATLADQLLDLSRLETGTVPVHPARFRPRERIDALLPRIVPERLEHVRLDVDPALEVCTDPEGFERIVSNLVINALRYGEPPVHVSCASNQRFRLVVEDRGNGVEPDFVPRLFERFTRSDMSRSNPVAGAGLGLSIANSFAEALGGSLSYEEADPRGARFVLELPLAA